LFKLKKETLWQISLIIFLNLFDISSTYGMKNHFTHSFDKLLFDLLIEQEFNLLISVLTLALISSISIENKIQWIIIFQKYPTTNSRFFLRNCARYKKLYLSNKLYLSFTRLDAETKNSKIYPKMLIFDTS